MATQETVTVFAEYSSCCFCNKPALSTIMTAWAPRFLFAKAVKTLAEQDGITNLWFGKNKTAVGTSPFICAHGTRQTVRFGWRSLPARTYQTV